MTWLGFANRVFFQWFFIRLTKCLENKIEEYKLLSFDLTLNGMASRGNGIIKTYEWYSIQYWILPTSGWGTNFQYLNKKPKFIKITRKHNKIK